MIRFPHLDQRGVGVGLDLPWDGVTGFAIDGLAEPMRAFLSQQKSQWAHAFFSWQPRDRAAPLVEDYAPAWDDLTRGLELPLALHHTALNLGATGPYRRAEILSFTRALCERYRLRWVNEDVGLWSLAGRPLPYPLPPFLNEEGLRATIANVRECQGELPVPLVLEFPGFSRGVSLVIGEWDAYDFFRALAEETEAPVTLDVGHLLSWRWWKKAPLFEDLTRLPLHHCFEIHLSGCQIEGDRFIDAHHGRLLDEQLQLAQLLIPLCPNLRAITFEDPRFDSQGHFLEGNERSWQRVRELG